MTKEEIALGVNSTLAQPDGVVDVEVSEVVEFCLSLVRTTYREAVEECAKVISDEKVSEETGELEDFAYNKAIEDCLLAVRRLTEKEAAPKTKDNKCDCGHAKSEHCAGTTTSGSCALCDCDVFTQVVSSSHGETEGEGT